MGGEEKNKIEDIKRNLYDPNDHAVGHQNAGVLHKVKHQIREEWEDDEKNNENNMNKKSKKPPVSIFKKFFIVAIVFFLGAIGFAFYKFSTNDTAVSNEKIKIEVIGNAFTKGGEDLPLQIEITNNNSGKLELAALSIEYPKGADTTQNEVVRLPRDVIGTIMPNETVLRNIKVNLYGEEKTIRNIKVSLDYHPEGSNAIFTKDKYYPVTISLAPISVSVEGPTNTISNQSISLKIKTTLNTLLPESKPILQVTYPNNFVLESVSPLPFLGNNVWDLSSLTTVAPIEVEIKGRLIGQDGDEQVFHTYVGTSNETNPSVVTTIFSSSLQKILIAKPFLEANILVNGRDQAEYSVSGGSTVNVEISWANNLPTRITDGQIIASLSGNVFDKSTVNPINGFYDSANNQIIWDKNSVPGFAEINPGEKGIVSFNFKPKSLIGVSTIKDPQVTIKVSIKGREPLFGSTYNDVNNFSEKIVKLLSDFQIVASANYSSGNLPPKAESETKYVINWTLSNSANNIKQAQARASLPIYVKWIGLTAGENENVSYNETTREITWNIGSVLPNTGINNEREASFVVSLNPSLSQVGSIPQLMKETYLSGTDAFSESLIKSTRGAITTSLTNDPNFKPINAKVIK